MPSPKTSETRMLQDVWRTAFDRGELLCEFNTESGAVRARMQLYNAVKAQKAGEDLDDMKLVHAAEQLEIVWVQKGPKVWSFRMQRRDKSDMIQGLAAAIGKRPEDYAVDPEAIASSERLLRELGLSADGEKAESAHKDNPFYGKREG